MHMSNPVVRDLFPKILDLKYKCFGARYSDSMLPVDTYDYISDHICICREEDGENKLVSCYKITTPDICKRFKMDYLANHIMKMHADYPEHIQTIERISNENTDVIYSGGWCVDPEDSYVKKGSTILPEFINFFTAVFLHCHMLYNADASLMIGIKAFKTDRYFEKWGFEPITDEEGNELSTFPLASHDNIESVFMEFKGFTKDSLRRYEKHRAYLEKHLIDISN